MFSTFSCLNLSPSMLLQCQHDTSEPAVNFHAISVEIMTDGFPSIHINAILGTIKFMNKPGRRIFSTLVVTWKQKIYSKPALHFNATSVVLVAWHFSYKSSLQNRENQN